MGNEIDEVTGSTDPNGRDINVINKQIRVEVGNESRIFEIALWVVGTIPGIIILTTDAMPVLQGVGVLAAGFLPGVIFQFMKISALAYLRRLQQKVQADASQIDNYLEQRVIILQNVVGLVEKSIELDKDVMKSVAAYRAGRLPTTDTGRNAASQELDGIFSRVNVAFEAYPELKAQATLADAMRQNSYLQKEITAARTLYNDTVAMWNQEIYRWPTNQIVAARAGYTTRIPFIASAETKAEARGTFF